MSIIIRLQNLPLSAKSADVRHFFGGLRIPSGGVHILGGEKGDAFIAFNSDEDARLAMRKDGGKLKDFRVRLFLSSYMEMQYEVDKITKAGGSILPLSPRQSVERRYSRSRSPEWRKDMRGTSTGRRAASRSPNRYGSRSRSPRRRSRRSVSPNPFLERSRSKSPRPSNYPHGHHETDESANSPFQFNSNENKLSTSELEAILERRITEALEKNSVFAMSEVQNPPTFIPGLDISYQQEFLPPPPVPYPIHNIPNVPVQNMQFPPISPFFDPNVAQFHPPSGIPPPFPINPMGFPNIEAGIPPTRNLFYVTVSGLEPFWSYKQIQTMFRGIFVPEKNIKWEVDNSNLTTGTAFIKLVNRDDFERVIANATFFFNNRRITVSECPDFISRNYFKDSPDFEIEHGSNQNLTYKLKGLPFTCTVETVANFFQGLEVTDTVIFHNKDGQANGLGYVCFGNKRDFTAALCHNGEKIGHRYIEMIKTTDRDMIQSKINHPNALSFTKYCRLLEERNLPKTRRPLCVLMTGLPFHTTIDKLQAFFNDSGMKPDAIHITLNNSAKHCDGRAFIEFINFRDFDLALKFNGTSWMDNMICLKQILYDEMIKILDTQKAKHHFETPANMGLKLNEPEKLPYVWEPPDVSEDYNMLHSTSDIHVDADRNMYTSQEKKVYSPQKHMRSNFIKNRPNLKQIDTVHVTSNKPKFVAPSPPAPTPVKKSDSSIKRVVSQKRQDAPPVKKQNNNFNKNIRKASPPEDNRQPIKFNVNKQLPITKANDTFEPSKNEEKFKLSKLSPDKETPKSSQPKKFQNSASSKKVVVKKPPVQVPKIKPPVRKQIPLRNERNFADNSHFKSKLKNNSFSRNQRNRVPPRPPFQRNVEPYEEDFDRNPHKRFPSPSEDPHLRRFPSPSEDPHFKRFSSPPEDLHFKRFSSPPEDPHFKRFSSPSEDSHFKRFSSPSEDPHFKRFSSPTEDPHFKRFSSPSEDPHFKRFSSPTEDPHFKRFSSPSEDPHFKRFSSPSEELHLMDLSSPPREPHFRRPPNRSKVPHASRFPSPPRAPECIVQMSNVSLEVNTQDLLHFLEGFAFNSRSVTRRYTVDGDPTCDVRVAFLNRKEAELVIRSLNGLRLKGMRINMFIT